MTITLPPELEKALEAEVAAGRGRSVEALVLDAVRQRLEHRPSAAQLLEQADRIRALTPPGPNTDSAEILAAARSERYGR